MDSSADARLQRLQMADLGTARREYISTREAKRHVASRLEDIEASRMSNVAGSEAQRLAQNNKERLSQWSTLHKEVGDADDLEQLDELMNGQSHRANLSAKVQESGGQTYSKSTKKDDNFLRLQRSSALRAVQSSGRGEGFAGTRARVPQALPRRTPNQGAVAKIGHHVPQDSRPKTRPLDPALDPDEDFYKKNHKSGHLQGERGRGNTKVPEQPPRARRAPSAANYTQVLSDPNDFLAHARNLVKTRAPSNASAQSTEASHTSSPDMSKQGIHPLAKSSPKASKPAPPTGPASGTTSRVEPASSTPDTQRPAPVPSVVNGKGNHAGPKDVIKQTPKPSKAAPTRDGPTGTKSGALASRVSTPARSPSTVNNQGNRSITKGLSSSQHASPFSKPLGTPAKQSPVNPQQSTPQKPAPQDGTAQAGPDSTENALLDLSTTPSTDEMLSSSMNKMSLMSPGMNELKGVDFTQCSNDTSRPESPIASSPDVPHPANVSENSQKKGATRPPPGLVHPGDRTFEEAMDEYEKTEKGPADTDQETQSESNTPGIDHYRREISVINNFMSTATLSSGTMALMQATLRELERKIEGFLQKPSGVPSQSGGIGEQKVGTLPSTPLNSASNGSLPITRRESQLRESYQASPTPQMSTKGGNIQPSPQPKESPRTKSPSPLRSAVTAAPFVPGRRTSFTQYRSPQNSISSESTIFQQPLSVPEGHIFGNHLLPGQHTLPSSASKFDASPSKSSYHSDESKWSYHTAPQSSVLSNTTKVMSTVKEFSTGASSTNTKTPKEAAASLAPPANTPETLKTPTQATFNAPPPSRPNFASQPDRKSSATQQSMHAPRVSHGPVSSTSSSKHAAPARTASSDLQRSRYAPENYKPW